MSTSFRQRAFWEEGSPTSTVVDLQGYRYVALYIPAGFSGATLTFSAAPDPDGQFLAVEDDSGDPVSVSIDDEAVVSLVDASPSLFPLRYIRLITNVNQAADAVVDVLLND
jgi:hypothetical protein